MGRASVTSIIRYRLSNVLKKLVSGDHDECQVAH